MCVNHFGRLIVKTFLVLALMAPAAEVACAQGMFGGGWFDWSDFRAETGVRFLVAHLKSGTVNRLGVEYDLKGPRYAFDKQPLPFGEFWAELFIDRLGIRLNYEPHTFAGINSSSESDIDQQQSRLQMPEVRVGLDLNIIRNQFVRAGVNYDYYFESVKFYDRSPGFINDLNAGLYIVPAAIQDLVTERFAGQRPMTVGLQGRILPFRLFDIPTTMQGRVRIPVPFLNRKGETKITDWDVSFGLRPAIWDTSLYGHATFNVDLEFGYRSISFEMTGHLEKRTDSTGGSFPIISSPSSVDLRSHWEGLYVQAGIFF